MNLQKKARIVALLLIAIPITGIILYKIIYKPHVTIEEEKLKFIGVSDDLIKKVQSDAISWNGAIIQISGKISSKDNKGIALNANIYCQLKYENELLNLQEGQPVIIKGRIIGYDDLLEELKLDKSIIIK
ncbi:hypothetical protein [Aquimarina sp. 2201CG5-10]|uniref:hypothetical protein n=1 Tax=Aquimarina callyspongiae TaxID=3098150 RepID=UPI002AB51781|nr:hypothetical protein [Aquimarina sp. 2201CG5-10]MDY8137983.1 hypothetical protein [Aquimarina sp. 2201CG5-10]